MAIRPSELYDIDNSFDAYCFDSAVVWFGKYVEAELAKVDKQGQKELRFHQLMQDELTKRYRDPMELVHG